MPPRTGRRSLCAFSRSSRAGTTVTAAIRAGAAALLLLGLLLVARAVARARQVDLLPQLPFERIAVDAGSPSDVWGKGVGDLDGDGDVDLIAGGFEAGGLVWYENPGWTKHGIAGGAGFETDIAVCDLDEDGDLDVMTVIDRSIAWYENPDWTFRSVSADAVHDMELADLDGDGDCDLVARGQTEFRNAGDSVFVFEQTGHDSWRRIAVPVPDGEGLKVADLDGDGDPDIIVDQNWLENVGDDTWPRHTFTTTWTHEDAYIDVGDFDGDGDPDIVHSPAEKAGETYRLSWFEAPSDPRLPEWTEHVVADSVEAVLHFVGAADFDNDGRIDLATAEMTQGADPDEVRIYLNRGSGLRWDSRRIAVGGSHSMRVADIDGDGDADLWGGNWNGIGVHIYMNGMKGLSLDRWRLHVLASRSRVAVASADAADLDGEAIGTADLDYDGDLDIVMDGPDPEYAATARLRILENLDGHGREWRTHVVHTGDDLREGARLVDVDLDGDLDIVADCPGGLRRVLFENMAVSRPWWCHLIVCR